MSDMENLSKEELLARLAEAEAESAKLHAVAGAENEGADIGLQAETTVPPEQLTYLGVEITVEERLSMRKHRDIAPELTERMKRTSDPTHDSESGEKLTLATKIYNLREANRKAR